MPKAVIDLGTNTFHLLIAEVGEDQRLTEVYRKQVFVKLAAEGIATIGQAPFDRGIAALQQFRLKLNEYGVSDLTAIGTAALRTASNGPEFLRAAAAAANIHIQLISGEEEADLITAGVLAALPPLQDRTLIMDIGGGSTEYIIADAEGVRWRQSFPVGVSVLHNGFHRADPISEADIRALEDHLAGQLAPLAEALQAFPTQHLVGAAGTFDVLADLLRVPDAPPHPTSHALDLGGFPILYQKITTATLAERLALPEVPVERADMIVVAMILLRFTIQLAETEHVTVSDYAMKEGILLSR